MSELAKTTSTQPPAKSTLEAAFVDWHSARVQFLFGFAFTLITLAVVAQEFFATRFLASEYLAVEHLIKSAPLGILAGSINDTFLNLEVILFRHHSWWYRAIQFVVFASSAMITGLITLDVTLRYGNRVGAAAAIFASLLYLTLPVNNGLTLPAGALAVLLSNLCGLSAIFLDLRLRLLREKQYFILAVLFLVLAGALNAAGAVSAILGIGLTRAFIKGNEKRSPAGPLSSFIGLTSYYMISLFFVVPQIPVIASVQTAALKADFLGALFTGHGRFWDRFLPIITATTFGIALTRLVIGSLCLRAPLFAATWFASLLAAWKFLRLSEPLPKSETIGLFIGPALCILLALCAVPAVDALKKSLRIAFTTLGSLVLSALVVSWGLLLIMQVHETFTQARELTIFKNELVRRMEATGGRLVVVNPPFGSTEDESTTFGLIEERDRDEKIFEAILSSPLTAQKIPLTTLRKLPTNFVRLSKKENSALDPTKPASMVTDFYIWSSESRQLMPIYYVGHSALALKVDKNLSNKMQTDPPQVARIESANWGQIAHDSGFVELNEDSVRLNPGSKEDLAVWFPHELLDPTKVDAVRVICSPDDAMRTAPLFLVFKGKDSDDTGVLQLHRVGSENKSGEDAHFEANTKGVVDWNKHSGIAAIGIKVQAGTQGVVLKAIETKRGAKQ